MKLKDLLQKWYKKNYNISPIYTQSYDKTEKKWRSTLTLFIDGSTFTYKGYGKREKKSDQKAARKACIAFGLIKKKKGRKNQENNQSIKIRKISEKVSQINNKKHNLFDVILNKEKNPIYVLVDYENIHNISLLGKIKSPRLTIIKITSFLNSNAREANYVPQSALKDATDHYISFYIGMLICKNIEKMDIIILTRDHFASTLVDFFQRLSKKKYKYNPFS